MGAGASKKNPSTTRKPVIQNVQHPNLYFTLDAPNQPTSSVVLEAREQARRLHMPVMLEKLDHLFQKMTAYTISCQPALPAKVAVPVALVDMWEHLFLRGLAEGDVQIFT